MNYSKDSTSSQGQKSSLKRAPYSDFFGTYRYSLIGLFLAIILLFATICFDLDLFEKLVELTIQIEFLEIDEFILPIVLFLSGCSLNLIRIARKRYLQNQRIEVYKNMMLASNHVLKTCMNQMMLVRLAAEETPDFDPEMIKLFDRIVASSKDQLEALGKIENLSIDAIWQSIYDHSITEIEVLE
ncbi:hypothetical protein [Roseivirga sp. E12]|uniref:hypothetical protein n=1 Tax=Roseivirga sp. E12 TaxID=2819237 RepID=UPI001ABCD80C|nr:hypothetical protein [Roseivirga sp. E12]MBO3697413.1 hypothetical protein [Roseivirga sp. E12]